MKRHPQISVTVFLSTLEVTGRDGVIQSVYLFVSALKVQSYLCNILVMYAWVILEDPQGWLRASFYSTGTPGAHDPQRLAAKSSM